MGDLVLLQQVVLNLVKNALEASDPGGRHRVVRVRASREGRGRARVAVSDGGKGLSKSEFDEYVIPFATSKTSGMGFGLPLCRSIVESHDGRLWIQEDFEKGTTVGFSIPLADQVDG